MLKIRQQQFDLMSKVLLKNDEESLIVQVIESSEPVKMAGSGPLIIRKEQNESLAKVSLAVFEERMMQHLNECFPQISRSVGEQKLRPVIQQGIARAAEHGITSEIDVARYIDLSLVLGLDFDSGVQHPQASEIIKDQTIKPGVRMQLIFDYVKRLYKERKKDRSQRDSRKTA